MKISRRRCLLTLGTAISAHAHQELHAQWRSISTGTDGVVGAAALHLGSGQLSSLNGDERFPLASVCKLPIAMNLLALADEGKFALRQEIEVLPRDVVSSVSPLAARWPAQRRFPLEEMIELMVAHSDNTAVETLFRIGGEGPTMAARFREWKAEGVRVDRSERQCGLDRNGVVHYPPSAEWTDETIRALIDKTHSGGAVSGHETLPGGPAGYRNAERNGAIARTGVWWPGAFEIVDGFSGRGHESHHDFPYAP